MHTIAPTLTGATHLLYLKASFNTFWFVKVVLNKTPFTDITKDDSKQLALNDTWKSKLFQALIP